MFKNMLFKNESIHIQGECCYSFDMVYYFSRIYYFNSIFFNHENKLQ